MHNKNNSIKSNSYIKQRGVALLVILLVLGSGALYALLRTLNENNLKVARDKKTAEALALAKQELIRYAVARNNLQPNSPERPGDLPCPDLNNDGASESSCGNANGSSQSTRLGRLPWSTLGLPDMRDSSGERLWYAVSNNFKKSNRREPLNSNTYGTITVRNTAGIIINNGMNNTAAIAIIIAPGSPIARQGILQNRSGAGVNSAVNYLDSGLNEDNADFVDGAQNGFILQSSDGAVNDQISVITYQDLMPLINQRVQSEVRRCSDVNTCYLSTISAGGWWVKNNWQSIYPAP